MSLQRRWSFGLVALVCLVWQVTAAAAPSFVFHNPATQVFSQPGGITMREPETPREGETVSLWIKVGPSFTYNAVAVYYTENGSEPQGTQGVGQVGTLALLSYGPNPPITFQFNEPGQNGNDDWWLVQLPIFTRDYGDHIRYKISAWDTNNPIPEVFANGGAALEFTNKIAWPGAGSGSPNPNEGYPPVHFWKEEAVAGNNYINVMIDQNGSLYDIYYPSAGCLQGMGTKNEGYADGPDTFPPLLPSDNRGQMNLNQAVAGLRVDGTTYWLSNAAGGDYTDVSQAYLPNTNVVGTSQRLVAGGNNITIQQFDFSPKDIAYPANQDASPNRGLFIKRMILTNNGGSAKTVNVYFYVDQALNGGDNFDGMFHDAARGAIIPFENELTTRLTSARGEYNPTTFSDYEKTIKVYLGCAMKLCDAVGSAGSAPAGEFSQDTSSDTSRGWTALQVTLAPGVAREIDIGIVGGYGSVFDTGSDTYVEQVAPGLDWFHANSMASMQAATESYWTNWLNSGVSVNFPDDRFDETFKRGLLATALHLDGENGGIIAGMHNGAYPFVWPRDAAWAAITLARAGHTPEAREIFRFLKDIAYRDVEGWGRKGFWKQKYTTDGYTIWAAPQVDETSCYPWGVKYLYDVTGDLSFLESHYDAVFDAAIACSCEFATPVFEDGQTKRKSTVDGRLYYSDTFSLSYSMSLWEDAFGFFNYSNASIVRAFDDAASIANTLDQLSCPGGPGTCNYHNDVALFNNRSNAIRGGLDSRLAWNGENCDISQLGITYPFEVYPANHARAALIADRINGVANDAFGNNQPLVNFGGEWGDLINRYHGDGYWNNSGAPNPNGSPWFLSTMWYGCYYAMRQDLTPGKGDIDNHRHRLDLLLDRLGPVGFGAEQIGPSNSLSYPGQTDFVLQAAWPNAWESMSFFVDSMMLFLDYTPDADGNTLRIEPKLPTGWNSLEFKNIELGAHRIDVVCSESGLLSSNAFTNRTGNAVNFDTQIRVPAGSAVIAVTRNGAGGCSSISYTYDAGTGRVHVTGSLDTGANAVTSIDVRYGLHGDFDAINGVDLADVPVFVSVLLGDDTGCEHLAIGDMNGDQLNNGADVQGFVDALVP